jgi:hypothetical protein
MTSRYAASREMVARKVRNEYLLVPLSHNAARLDSLYILNEIAAFIWEQLQNSVSINELVAMIVETYDVDRTTARDDVHRVLDKLMLIDALRLLPDAGR